MWTLKTEMKPHKHTLHVAQIFDGQTAFRCLMRLWAPWGDAASQNHILNLIRANALMNITAELHPAARTHEWRHETSRAVIIFPPHHTDKHQHHCRSSSVIACFMIVWLFVFIQFFPGVQRDSQRLSGHHPLCQPVQSPTVGEDHHLAEMWAGHLLLPVLRRAVDACVLPRRLLEDKEEDGSVIISLTHSVHSYLFSFQRLTSPLIPECVGVSDCIQV